ncbi:MAG: hypothetical protein ABSC46_00290 [Candidatus Limnocylindrales bacterium]
MFGSRRLAAVFLIAAVAGACLSGGATTAPLTATPSPGGGGGLTAAAPATAAVPASAGGGGGGALGGTVAPGGNLCGLLGPGDFAAVGVTGARTPTKNSDAPTDAYCVYAGVSSATGGIEFDVFIGDPEAT